MKNSISVLHLNLFNFKFILMFLVLFLSKGESRIWKKTDEVDRKLLLSRVGTNLKVGIVGVPNVGKSTFFNVLTKSSAPAENFPFCTVDPNETRRVPVPDERFDYLVQYHKPARKVPAYLTVVDIAGLVKGAADGQGLGNNFLAHIAACDAIFHLCRAFDDNDVTHVEGEVNPVRDIEIINEELRLKDEVHIKKEIVKVGRFVLRGDQKLKPEYDALVRIRAFVCEGKKKHARYGDWTNAQIKYLNKLNLLTSKTQIYLVNLSEEDYIKKQNKWLLKIKEWVSKNDPGAPVIPFSGVFEQKLVNMPADKRQKYLKEHKTTSALNNIITAGYKALQLQYFFTAGPDEVKAWTIQKGSKAPHAAGKIHTDFEKGFIKAEVMHFEDFKKYGSEAACRAAGKCRQQGRLYTVEDGDTIFFKFNPGGGVNPKKKA